MKTRVLSLDDDEMPAEFDFSRSIPNPWFVAIHRAKHVRVIDKDLAAVFPNDESVNAALRSSQTARSKRANTPIPPLHANPKRRKHD
ncbi:MAG: hypothetical protein WB973_11920 [Thermoanaerobaculia bacterium]